MSSYEPNDFDQSPETETGNNGTAVSMHAGFPNAAEDRTGKRGSLDFNALLVKHPSSTYCFRVQGDSHEDRGIFDGDIAVVDRALQPRPSDLVIYFPENDFVICRYSQLRLPAGSEIWGVVTAVIHRTRS